MLKDNLGNRMKTYYEEVSKTKLTRRIPVIIRLDGKAFHTFTRGFKKPFDDIFMKTMQETMKYLCENIQGCVLGYTQSDEITLVLVDYNKLDTSAWFDYEVQKMTSIAASMATLAFNKAFYKNCENYFNSEEWLEKECLSSLSSSEEHKKYKQTVWKAMDKGAMFDARVFNIPKEEVTNCVLWRQKDAERNSILSVAQANYSQKELEGKSCKELVAKLELEKGIIWGNLPTPQKRGTCCIKDIKFILPDGQIVSKGEDLIYEHHKGNFYSDNDDYYFSYITASGSVESLVGVESIKLEVKEISKWILDYNIPCFVGDGRNYIEKLIYVGDN